MVLRVHGAANDGVARLTRQIFELLTGDYLFDPAAGARYNKDDDHIAQISELCGPFPKSIALAGKFSSEIFTRKAELRHIQKLRYWRASSSSPMVLTVQRCDRCCKKST